MRTFHTNADEGSWRRAVRATRPASEPHGFHLRENWNRERQQARVLGATHAYLAPVRSVVSVNGA
ncbi:hypothetical protein IAG41_11655 [Sphingomonas sp. JC676]|uniref:hypothetical protein n=1 Tax=Sphingomonas sp. JC676 TaxID=2768065 RepID=UPI0016583352|nr:hypothetical protein [Sphingomonas sp. JC676]MBC9033051.1 hypothetical protein [Sphingomonas sp. JC676]